MDYISLYQMTAKSGREKELMKALQALLDPTRQEPGCIAYELWHDTHNPRSFIMYERFKNKEAFDQHVQASYVQKFVKNEFATCIESQWGLIVKNEL